MGLITFLSSNPLGKKIEKAIEKVGTVLNKPIASAKEFLTTGSIKKTEEKFVSEATKSPVKLATKTALGYGTAIVAVTGAGTALEAGGVIASRGGIAQAVDIGLEKSASAISKIPSVLGKSFVKAPIPTTAGVLIGAPLVAGVISQKPELIKELPQKAFETGQGLVNTIEEHPVASAVLGGVTGGVIIGEIIKKLTGTTPTTPNSGDLPKDQGGQSQLSTSADSPVLRPTETVSSGTSKKRRRTTRKQTKTPQISIKIDNRDNYNANKRFK